MFTWGREDFDKFYKSFEGLDFTFPSGGVLQVTFNRPDRLNALTEKMHEGLSTVWPVVEKDNDVRVVVLHGANNAFSAGGDLDWVARMGNDFNERMIGLQEARDLVLNILNFSKPIVAAVEGPAVGAALAAALLSDISIVARNATLVDGHTRLGIAAGDHATILWPLLCGMAKAKYYLLLCKKISGEEAERHGLVSLAVEEGKTLEHAMKVANDLAQQSQSAVRWTKQSLNMWIKQAAPIFEMSLGLEFIGMGGNDIAEGVAAIKEKRRPVFIRK